MEYRTLGQSDIKVSELAFGAWTIGGWLWGGADSKDAIKAIETAVDHGMTTIDTAAVYGFGLSEELVGKAIKGKRARVQILTKFGLTWNEKKGEFFFASQDNAGKDVNIYRYSSKEKVISDCDQSLKRLGTDYIDQYQIHWADPTTPVSETMEALEILVKKGKIKQGHKFNDGDSRPSTIYYQEPNLSGILQLTDNLKEIANELKITLSQLVLNWTIQQPGITCALAGARNAAQVLENVKAADFRLTSDEINRINELLSKLKLETKI